MIPHQIYCDFLEDKGIDCRLLRILDPESLIYTSHHSYYYQNFNPVAYPGILVISGDCESSWDEEAESICDFGIEDLDIGNGDGNGTRNHWHKDGNGWGCGDNSHSNGDGSSFL